MKRTPYFLCIVGFVTIDILLKLMVYENEDMAPLVIILGLILMISAIVCHVKRCHDIGKSGWFILWLLVPIVNLFVLLYLFFTPSAPSSGPVSSGPAEVDQETCIGCGVCLDACPAEAIEMVDGRATVDPEKCVECGVCVDECPSGYISLKTYDSKVKTLIKVTPKTSEELPKLRTNGKPIDSINLDESLMTKEGQTKLDNTRNTIEKKEERFSEKPVKSVPYFEVPIRVSVFRCSDNACPCSGSESLIPGKTGYVYISKEVVEVRKDALTLERLNTKLQKAMSGAGPDFVYFDQGTIYPILLCEQGARRRNLNLEVAAIDAKYGAETGLFPLRSTPIK